MLEVLAKPLGSIIIDLLRRLLNKSHVDLYCACGSVTNGNEIGTFLALSVKIVNPGDHTIYFERIEAVNDFGETFYPLFFVVNSGTSIQPRKNIVGHIPCGYVRQQGIRKIHMVDATERRYTLKGRLLKKSVEALLREIGRLESLNHEVHPTHPYPISLIAIRLATSSSSPAGI